MRKIKVCIIVVAMLVLSAVTLCYGATKSDVKVIYNAHTLDFGDKGVVNQDGSLYIPIRAFSEKLHYTVDWNATTNTARIYDNLNDIYLSTNGDLKVNGVESKSEKVPIKVDGSIYVPLRFVSETLGVAVNYDSSNKVVNMNGRTIYEIYQKDVFKPQLVGFTSDGKKITLELGDKTGEFTLDTMSEYNKTKILYVNRTEYSDVITTEYVYSGALTVNERKQIYVHGTSFVEYADLDTYSFDPNTEKTQGTKYYDDRVAFLEDGKKGNIVKIYDDKTGTLIKEFNSVDTFNSNFSDISKSEYNGEIHNIQAVGEDFLVVNMLQPNTFLEVDDYVNTNYHTTVINLNTMKITPVYQHLDVFKNKEVMLDGSYNNFVGYGSTASDGVYFTNRTNDGKLKFVARYGNFNQGRGTDSCVIDYK